MSCDPSKICPVCDAAGLPLLPVRYAVARTDLVVERSRAPSLREPFKIEGLPLPADQAETTLRLLRGGYLYVYIDKRSEWKAYAVTDSAHLVEFDIHSKVPPRVEDATPCARMAMSQSARCIMIPDAHRPELLGKVWIAYSEVAWTGRVLRRHEDAGYRERHMRSIDTAAWVASNGSPQPHLAPMNAHRDEIAEFKFATGYSVDGPDGTRTLPTVTVTAGAMALNHSLVTPLTFDRNSVSALGFSMHQAAGMRGLDKPGVPPAIVALDDPTGIAGDLNALIQERVLEWNEEPERKEKRETALTIVALRESIKNGAVLEREELHRDVVTTPYALGRIFAPTTTGAATRNPHEWGTRYGEIEDEERLRAIHEKSWDKYVGMLKDASAYQDYLDKTFPAEQAEFERKVLNPVDKVYISWLKSAIFRNYFVSNFDTENLGSGVAYTHALTVLFKDATGRRTVCEYLSDCLRSDIDNPESIELRALAWNQDAAVEAWKKALASTPDPSINWNDFAGRIYSGFKDLVEKGAIGELNGPFSSLAKFAYQMSNPITRSLGELFDVGATRAARHLVPHNMLMGWLGAMARVENPDLVIVDTSAATDLRTLTRQMARGLATVTGMNEQGLRAGARDLISEGRHLPSPSSSQRVPLRVVALVDRARGELMRGLGGNRSSAGNMRRELMGQILKPIELDLLLSSTVTRVSTLEFKGNLVATMFAVASLGGLYREAATAANGQRAIKIANLGAGMATTMGALVETTSAALKNTPLGASPLARPMGFLMLNAKTRGELWIARGKWMGAAGAWVAAGLMIYEGASEVRVSKAYGRTMIALGFGMIVAAAMTLFGWAAPLGFVLAIIFSITAAVVAYLKPDQIHHWLNSCLVFGKHGNKEFSSLADQELALRAIGGG